MKEKLTLRLDEKVVKKANSYAIRHGVSLSGLVEAYFLSLVEPEEKTPPVLTGVVAELTGILDSQEVDLSKKGRVLYLTKKHS